VTDRDDDDPQLTSLRAVWLNMPDEDPPERGLAELMAAARVKADEMARPSWWQRLVALLRRPPVLALATVLVLLGGAVFIGQRRDKLEAVPEVASEGRAQNSVEEVPPVQAVAPAQEPELERNAVPAPAMVAPAEEAAPARGAPPEEPKLVAPERQRPARVPRPRGERTAPGRAPARTGGRGATAHAPETTITTGTLHDKDAIDGVSFGLESTSSAPAPESQAHEAPKAAATAELASDADEATSTRAASPPSRAAQYLAQAKSAAARGDCAAARVLMKRAASADAAAYRKALASDAALKKCQ
jgi:hypothetical protein